MMFKELFNDKVRLLPFSKTDKALFVQMAMCSQSMRHVASIMDEQEALLAFEARLTPWQSWREKGLFLSINDVKSGEKVGSMSLHLIPESQSIAEVGFMIKPNKTGQGYGQSALSLLVALAQKELALSALHAVCSVDNIGSSRVLEKHHFVKLKRLNANTHIGGNWVDDLLYQLTFNG